MIESSILRTVKYFKNKSDAQGGARSTTMICCGKFSVVSHQTEEDMLRAKFLALAASASFALSGCMTLEHKFDPELVEQLQPNVSTISDATRLLGPYVSESKEPAGKRLLQWQYSQGTRIGRKGAHVAILFDQAGKMIEVTHKYVFSID